MIKKFILFTLLTLLSTITNADQRPNIIVIMADDLGYGDLSIQGGTDLQTPHIDAIAKQGLTFNQFYANSTVCSPSRAAFLSGKSPDMVGVPGVVRQIDYMNWGYFDPNIKTLPDHLKEHGYHTALVGKWHLGLESPNTPNERGFEHFHGFLGDMMDDYWTHLRGGINWMRLNDKEVKPKGHATDIFTNWAVDYLDSASKKKQPFFLFLAYNAPHFPIQPPDDYLAKVQKREPQLSEKRAKNVAFVEHLDDAVGRVMEKLVSLGIDDNTLVVFTSDNGGALRYAQSNGKLRAGKGDLYEGGIRVPTYFRWPGKIKVSESTEVAAQLSDLLPTFIELASSDKQAIAELDVEGLSLLPVLTNPTTALPERTIFWMRREGWGTGGLVHYAARRGDYKLVQNTPFEPYQYFNLADDPYEKNPLAEDSHPVLTKLKEQVSQHIRKSGGIPWQKPE